MTAAIQKQFEQIRASGVPAQMIRYGLAGGLSTLIYASVYLPLTWAIFPGGRAVFAVPFAFAISLIAGFFLHSLWSFAGHGSRDNSGTQHAKFLTAHCFGLALNMLFTWTLTAGLGAPAWTPLLTTISITPLMVFLLQRQWVFA